MKYHDMLNTLINVLHKYDNMINKYDNSKF